MKKGDVKRHFFIAVCPPDHVCQDLNNKLNNARPSDPDWEWKQPENYHISLAFPGPLDDKNLQELKRILSRVNMPSFDMKLEGMGVFMRSQNSKQNNTHVVWARPDNKCDNALRRLHYKIANLISKSGFKYGKRDVTPHITIVKTPVLQGQKTHDYLNANHDVSSDEWHCDSFGLYETIRGSDPDHPRNNNGQGSKYRKVESFQLTP